MKRFLAFPIITALAGALLAIAPAAHAQYSFTLIADSTSPTFSDFGSGTPSINEWGTVAFYASRDVGAGGGNGIFTGAGGATTTIALSTGPTFSGGFSLAPAINSAGTVAFYSFLQAGGTGIFTVNGGVTTTIADNSSPTFSGFVNAPAINSAGTVAFHAILEAGGTGIFTGDGGVPSAIAESTSATFSSFGSGLAINTGGTVAFRAGLDLGGEAIFTGVGGATTIAGSASPIFTSFAGLSINTAGTVAFRAFLDAGDGSTSGIFTGAGGATTTVALTSGPTFSGVVSPSINTGGTVAFLGLLDAGGLGIYVGDGGAGTRVIGTGDALFGSTVTDLRFGMSSLNDAGQLAFTYTLANGTQGVAVATVPEPGSALLVAFGTLGLLARSRWSAR